ncbi:hypothetical protein BJ742DRAFT_836385 [Cladochytrium replicatum]|nr:hypothetical protein BJ742DRAFT_836385 [Cladochytrium replicatum]
MWKSGKNKQKVRFSSHQIFCMLYNHKSEISRIVQSDEAGSMTSYNQTASIQSLEDHAVASAAEQDNSPTKYLGKSETSKLWITAKDQGMYQTSWSLEVGPKRAWGVPETTTEFLSTAGMHPFATSSVNNSWSGCDYYSLLDQNGDYLPPDAFTYSPLWGGQTQFGQIVYLRGWSGGFARVGPTDSGCSPSILGEHRILLFL